jgi:hypothetical protein
VLLYFNLQTATTGKIKGRGVYFFLQFQHLCNSTLTPLHHFRNTFVKIA